MRLKPQLVLRAAGWLAIGLVTLELAARTEDKLRYGAPFFGNYSMESLYAYDAREKYGQPGASYLKWHLNEAGYRGPSLRAGTYRIVCMGSSETFGLYESPNLEWPRQLEGMLNTATPGAPYEVVDAAYPGLSTATTLLRLPRTLATLHPQMVVLYPSYTPYVELTQPARDPVFYAASAPAPPLHLAQPQHFTLRMQARFDTLMKASLPDALQHRLRAWQMRHAASSGGVMDTLPATHVAAFQSDLDRLVTQLQAHGVQVVLVTHANRFASQTPTGEEREVLTDWRKFFPTLTEQGLLDMERRMSDVVRTTGAAHHVPVVDAATQIPPGKAQFAEFVHFTDRGAARLASLVAAEIEREHPVAP